ncbi:HdeD family acid-resistance protein [Brachybacterium huguangmaarense]|uniref:HdeD family acid-resistance protein n=1 Tax=Brachybacterium huguangmaarense TaxID=1652028 RepID=A0ABY6G303_9MICO|nr:HdeD family acid-resistance protein [Brachybacterium huguangmaarense]UYG17587.1 HdeD family acid-resistance protein [Brachybacterium huguangmaarense]
MSTPTDHPRSPLEDRVRSVVRSGWKWLLALGILSVVVGIIALAWPKGTFAVVGILFGVYLVLTGIGWLAAASSPYVNIGSRILDIVVGVLSIVLGVICFMDFAQSIVLLGIWIGIGWLFAGATYLTQVLSWRGAPGRGWAVAGGVLQIIGGLMLLFFPFATVAALVWLFAVWLIVVGALQIGHAFTLRRMTR